MVVRLDSVALGIAGVCFGLIVGWALGSQQSARSAQARPEAVAQQASSPAPGSSAPPLLDQDRVQSLQSVAERDPANIDARVQLGNLYYDAERYEQAVPWYEAALELNAKDANVSTDLGVAYYQMNQPDRALEQFAHSLSVDPGHVKTLLNVGIVRAFGKQDLEGATTAWRQVVDLAPGSQEAQIARRALESIAAAHQGLGAASSPESTR